MFKLSIKSPEDIMMRDPASGVTSTFNGPSHGPYAM